MKLLITGGAGFLGARLARTLLARNTLAGQTISTLVLADLFPPPADLAADPRVQARTGALLDQAADLGKEGFDGVFHLASAVSAECETDFDLGLRSNLDTTRALLDALRAQTTAGGKAARLVFASSVAVFGSDAALALPEVVRDNTLPTPQSSYGIHKFICEQLVADYTRKGFIDGRTARLMTVSVRPGRPNGAASSFLSGIIREPLAGVESVCPVSADTRVALSSPASTIEGLIAVFEASREDFGGRTALNLPAITVSVQEMLDALAAEGGADAVARVRFEANPAIAAIVGAWPARFEAGRSLKLGLKPDNDFRSIVRQYMTDNPQAVKG
ncbi:NAD-dependent epimerase/dehydratase family protein [Pigmentiphaga aceris]|uniref:NAD-dependent epimerase/dehydratase family protein n=1 Tax=Pigmentiphaga aceris TaxID=1940612 RepID=A0A5C0B0V9_9BURK|nr:D-erythronate dehydrogenase [Pigmentiphaga aceris]QEI08282.1 NAD-dependent epimerase/dehydratase family protein [Pigmentiphaga aceris]